MTATVPRETRRTVWVLYLGGKTLDLIADLTGISKTSVFNIVQDTASYDPDYVLMRTLAVNLRKNGSDLSQYASINRISSLLEEYGVDFATGEDLIGKLLSTCYKLQWAPSDAVLTLQKFSQSAARYGHSPMEHANFFNKLQSSEAKLYLRIIQARKKLRDLTQNHDIVQDNLDIFFEEDGVMRWVTNNKMTTIESECQISELKKDIHLSQQSKSIDPDELSKLNESFIVPVSEQEVVDKLEDIRRHPSMYSYLFDKPIPTGPASIAGASQPQLENTLKDPPDLDQKEVSVEQN